MSCIIIGDCIFTISAGCTSLYDIRRHAGAVSRGRNHVDLVATRPQVTQVIHAFICRDERRLKKRKRAYENIHII